MQKHSTKIGGSIAERLVHCPGSHNLAAKMPPQPASEYALEGSMLHEAVAAVLDEKDTLAGLRDKFQYENLLLTGDLVDEMLEPALDQFNYLCDDWGVEEFEVESRVHFGDTLPGCYGTADVIAAGGACSVVLDWKFGRGVKVDAVENYQMMFYAAAARLTPETADLFAEGKPIRLVIIQPGMGEPSIWETSHDALDSYVLRLQQALREMEAPEPNYRSGKWCRWCPAKPICPVLNEQATTTADLDIKEMTGKDLPAWLERAELLEQWIDAVRSLAHQTLEDGGEVPGWKLIAGRKSYFYPDEEKVVELFQSMRIPQKEIYPRKLISPAQARKLLKDSPKKLKRLETVIDSKTSGTKVARESHKAPAVLTGAKSLARLADALKVTSA